MLSDTRSGTIADYGCTARINETVATATADCAHQRWPQLDGVDVRFHGVFAYVSARLPDGDRQPLMRLRYGGSAARWGFSIYLASKDGYEDSILPTGFTAGPPEDALDTPCGLYVNDPTT